MENNILTLEEELHKKSLLVTSSIKNSMLAEAGKRAMDLDVQAGIESLEDIGLFINKINEFVSDTYIGLLNWIAKTEVIIDDVAYYTRQNNIRYLQTNYKNNKKLLETTNFLDIKDLKVPVLTGLKVDLKTYLKSLEDDYNTAFRKEVVFAVDVFKKISEMNGYTLDKNGDKLLDLDLLKKRIKQNNEYIKEMKKHSKAILNEKSMKDVVPLKQLVSKNKEFIEVVEGTIKTAKNYTIEEIEKIRDMYKVLVDEIDQTLNLMEVSKKSKIEHDSVSISVLSEYIRSLAEFLTLIGVRFYLFTTLVNIETATFELIDAKVNKEDDLISSIVTKVTKSINQGLSVFEKGL